MNDPETEGIVMIGEIGGVLSWRSTMIKEYGTKPVVGLLQDKHTCEDVWSCGAIIGEKDDTALAKWIHARVWYPCLWIPSRYWITMAEWLKEIMV